MSPVKIGEITKVDSQLQTYPYCLYLFEKQINFKRGLIAPHFNP